MTSFDHAPAQTRPRGSLPTPSLPSLVLSVLGAELGQSWRRTLRWAGLRRPTPLPLEALRPPDSALAMSAFELARSLEPAFLLNHSARTYAFGLAVGHALAKKVDREVLYVAAILHDLGLADAHQGTVPFELRGANAARSFCLEQGLTNARADLVHEAIALHTSLSAGAQAPEVALVHFGAGLDLIGYRIENVARETIEAVLVQWPRLRVSASICPLLAREAARTPTSPVGMQWRLGFEDRIARGPLNDRAM